MGMEWSTPIETRITPEGEESKFGVQAPVKKATKRQPAKPTKVRTTRKKS
jgi:hypothetical protein